MTTDQRAVYIKINSCKECPYMQAERNYTGDSFDLVFDWKCTKNHKAIISCMEWNDKPPPIPIWCPLKARKETQ